MQIIVVLDYIHGIIAWYYIMLIFKKSIVIVVVFIVVQFYFFNEFLVLIWIRYFFLYLIAKTNYSDTFKVMFQY